MNRNLDVDPWTWDLSRSCSPPLPRGFSSTDVIVTLGDGPLTDISKVPSVFTFVIRLGVTKGSRNDGGDSEALEAAPRCESQSDEMRPLV